MLKTSNHHFGVALPADAALSNRIRLPVPAQPKSAAGDLVLPGSHMITTAQRWFTMVLVSAADNNMPDAELQSIGDMVMHLPVFRDFDRSKLTQITGDCAKLLQDKEGLEKALTAIKEGLPEKLRETAYALGCEVAAADGKVSPEESRLLEMIASG
jgi:tellurite resistance protein